MIDKCYVEDHYDGTYVIERDGDVDDGVYYSEEDVLKIIEEAYDRGYYADQGKLEDCLTPSLNELIDSINKGSI